MATPVAFVVNGAAFLLDDVMLPTWLPPLALNENAWPLARFVARTHVFGAVFVARQP